MSETADQNVIDDPAASWRVLGLVRFTEPGEMAEAIQWLLTSPGLAGLRGARLKVDLRLQASGSAGYAKLVHFWREASQGTKASPNALNDAMAIVISNKAD